MALSIKKIEILSRIIELKLDKIELFIERSNKKRSEIRKEIESIEIYSKTMYYGQSVDQSIVASLSSGFFERCVVRRLNLLQELQDAETQIATLRRQAGILTVAIERLRN